MRTAIVYDRVNKFGGAERVLLTLHEMFPEAPLYTSVYDREKAGWAKVFPEIKTSFLQKIPGAKNNHEFLFWLMPLVFESFDFRDFDLVISVTSEFAKNVNVKNGKHICYCLTPTRYLWSGYDDYFGNIFLRFLINPVINYLRKIDKKAAKKPDVMIAISTEVQKRIKKYYGRKSEIIFPPVSANNFYRKNSLLRTSWPVDSFLLDKNNLNKYYLVVSRLVKYKKVDLVIEAFNELGLPLVIIGTGREEKKLKSKSEKNIIFLGQVTDEELGIYYKNAKALIFPQEEDFGITAVEAQAYGIPVIAYKKGGALDIISKKTGVFFAKQNKENIINAIKKFENLPAGRQGMKFDRKVIRKNAERFSEKIFKNQFLQVVKNLW